jgi:predicted  nucleic acid-binding Zn-ribbon protein
MKNQHLEPEYQIRKFGWALFGYKRKQTEDLIRDQLERFATIEKEHDQKIIEAQQTHNSFRALIVTLKNHVEVSISRLDYFNAVNSCFGLFLADYIDRETKDKTERIKNETAVYLEDVEKKLNQLREKETRLKQNMESLLNKADQIDDSINTMDKNMATAQAHIYTGVQGAFVARLQSQKKMSPLTSLRLL